jgi:hypothetical protein
VASNLALIQENPGRFFKCPVERGERNSKKKKEKKANKKLQY